ncbi:FAD/NAD(P)-binding protein [Thermodesulfobacteriota bacterium]
MIIETSTPQKDIYLPQMATVLKSEPMTEMERFFEFRLDSGDDLGHMPGQFAEVSVLGIGECPVSISSSPTKRGSFEMAVRKAGSVTQAMHRLKSGDKVGIRGPFGTHFPVEGRMKGKDIIFVSGGIGLIPLRSAINYILDNRGDYGELTILLGTKSPIDRLCIEEVEEWNRCDGVCCIETVDHSDAGWQGKVGVITTLMTDMKVDPLNTVAAICGPPVMYKFAIHSLFKMGVTAENIYLSLERHMKCGVGKCGHCQVNHLYVCQDGPVFNWADIAEVEEAIS